MSYKKLIKIIACLLICTLCNITSAYAQGVIIVNTDIEETENKLILDADDTGGDITLQFGQSLNKYLKWDDAGSVFAFNDDIDLDGNEIINFRIENLATAPTCDALVKGRIYHDTTTTYSYVCNGTDWLRIDAAGGAAGGGTDAETFILDQDNTGGDVTLQFGDALSEYLRWDDVEQRFYLSDELMIDGDFLPSTDNVYSLGSETNRWTNLYVSNGLTIADGDLLLGEGGFVVTFFNGEPGVGTTIDTGSVVKIDTAEVNAVELTTSKVDLPIGVASNDTAYGEVVHVVIIGKTTVKCVGGESTGDLIQTSNTTGYAQAGLNATKIIGTAVTDCSGPLGTLNAVIHLE